MFKNLLKDLKEYLPGKIIPFLFAFISIPFLTRLFPPEVYGNYTVTTSIISLLSVFIGWIGMANIRFYPKYLKWGKTKWYKAAMLKVTLVSTSVISIFYLLILLIFQKSISDDLYFLLMISFPLIILNSFFLVNQSILRLNNNIKYFSFSTIWKSVVGFTIGILLVLMLGYGIEAMIYGNIIALLFIIWFTFKKSFNKFSLSVKPPKKFLLITFSYALPLVFGSLLATMNKFIDRFFLLNYSGSDDVGIYVANYAIPDQSLMFIITLLLYATHPLSIKIWELEGLEKSKAFLSLSTKIFILGIIPVIFGILSIYNEISLSFLGAKYTSGAYIIPIICISTFFFGVQQRFQSIIHFQNKTLFITFSMIFAFTINIILNIILIEPLGILGASISTLASNFTMSGFIIYYSRKFIKWSFPWLFSLKVLLISSLMLSVLIVIPNQSNSIYSLLIKIPLGVAIFTILSFLFLKKDIKSFVSINQ